MMMDRFFPFTQQAQANQLGLKRMQEKDWLLIDKDYLKHIKLKREILHKFPELTLSYGPPAEIAYHELTQQVQLNLLQYYPEYFELSCEHSFYNKLTNKTWSKTEIAERPLHFLAFNLQEDMCLLDIIDGVPVLTAGHVCFPAKWNLQEKIGLPLDEIHLPVPFYQKNLAQKTNHFLNNINIDRPVTRLNWSIHNTDTLFLPAATSSSKINPSDQLLKHLFLRTERQTLRKLPLSGKLIFTIKTFLWPINEIIKSELRHQQLLLALVNLPSELVSYKGMSIFYHDLLKKLKETPAQVELAST